MKAMILAGGLTVQIKSCLDNFKEKYPNSERNEKQKEKTKIALEWALNTSAKKIYWVCTRVQVCGG